ncbi:MAG: site-specific DNA-methyltransferase [Candidatus Peribacteria bacterium]|jgi:hypothetical protein|nr:site-specific DNA-methyltransferase [Candidatus Peribacteria bacterium]
MTQKIDMIFNHNWSFKDTYSRDYLHNYFKYPAMMVPQMIRHIINEFCSLNPDIQYIYDPFVGSGTVLTESMLQGLNFSGRDINPLSILLCKVKAGPFYERALINKINSLLDSINKQTSYDATFDFKNIDKWFRQDVKLDLLKIKKTIEEEKYLWARRFFWVAFAETIRVVSNSRTTTYKLHIRENFQIETRKIDTIKVFTDTLKNNFKYMQQTYRYLKDKKLLKNGIYVKDISIIYGDTREDFTIKKQFDLVLTSPPYGDNHTTVTYGQYSYLPLQWINLRDIDDSVDKNYLDSISKIDRISLGGVNYTDNKYSEGLINISSTYKEYVKLFEKYPKRFIDKITSFFYDLNRCLDPIIFNLKDNGHLILVLGNRTVCGVKIELDKVLIELLYSRNIYMLNTLHRVIHSKRMARKNKTADTISKESILIFKK